MRWLVLLALLVGCPTPQQPRQPSTALTMIEASVDLDGKPIGRTNARATIVVLMASWCGHCRAQLAVLEQIQAEHPNARILGVNYQGHEEYDDRGGTEKLRAYVDEAVPWLRVVPAGDELFGALGKPPFVPAVWVFDRDGTLVEFYDRREREPPTSNEIVALLAKLGA